VSCVSSQLPGIYSGTR